MAERMTEAELFALPVTVDIPTAGRAWGMNKNTAYERAHAGEFPCEIQPLGKRFVVTKVALLRALGYPEDVQHGNRPAA